MSCHTHLLYLELMKHLSHCFYLGDEKKLSFNEHVYKKTPYIKFDVYFSCFIIVLYI